MKLLSMLAILSTLTFSNIQAQETTAGDLTVSVAGAASWIALSVYAPEAAIGLLGTTATGYTLISLGVTALANQKAIVRNAVNSDAQEFYTTGNLTSVLAQSISLLKKSYTNLSDAEALDLIVASVNE